MVEYPPEPGNAGLFIICGNRRGVFTKIQEKLSDNFFVW